MRTLGTTKKATMSSIFKLDVKYYFKLDIKLDVKWPQTQLTFINIPKPNK